MDKHTEDARRVNGVTYDTFIEDDKLVLKGSQDMSSIIDSNTAHRNEFKGYKGEFHRAASIPNLIVDDLMRKGIWQDSKRLKAWLNDPDNRAFRTSTGKI